MIYRYTAPVIAVALLVFAVAHAISIQKAEPQSPPPVSPFGETVAGAGIVEPSTEASGTGNIAVRSQVAGAVTRVAVSIGQTVKAGDVLFELDKRQAKATLNLQQAALNVAEQQLRMLKMQPRPEEISTSEAQVGVAEANLREMQDHYARAKVMLKIPGAVAEEDVIQAQESVRSAQAQLDSARANLALLKAGTWEPNISIAAATVEQAKAQVAQAQTTLDLLNVRAPADGTILQVNVRAGEYVSTFGGQSLIVMGNLQPLHVRVNVDEEDLPRLKFDAPAFAKIRGDSTQEPVPLSFVRLEPYIVPKTSLTGQNIERVDARVVQLIYAIDPNARAVLDKKILVGQLLDVFIYTGEDALSPPTYDHSNVAKSTSKSDQIK